MKIVHIISGLSVGGAEMMLLKLVSSMDNKKFTPVVISLMDGGEVRKKIEQAGIPVYSLGMRKRISSLLFLFKIRKLMRHLKPDVIQGWMYHGNLVSSLARGMCQGSPKVFWNIRHSLHNLDDEKQLTRILIKISVLFAAKVTNIIYNSKISESQHVSIGYPVKKSVVIPNGFDLSLFKPTASAKLKLRKELDLPKETLLVGMIGRYHPLKDHNNFLRAAGIAFKKNMNLYFLLAGRNIDLNNAKLHNDIVNNKLLGRVFLLGERDDIPMITAALDVAVLSSNSEAFPNVVGEAMACEVPCVVTDVGDAAWMVRDTGKVVPARNAEELAAAILEIISYDEIKRKKLGNSARRRIKEYFSLPNVCEQYESIYSNIT